MFVSKASCGDDFDPTSTCTDVAQVLVRPGLTFVGL